MAPCFRSLPPRLAAKKSRSFSRGCGISGAKNLLLVAARLRCENPEAPHLLTRGHDLPTRLGRVVEATGFVYHLARLRRPRANWMKNAWAVG